MITNNNFIIRQKNLLFWFSGKPSKLKHGGERKIWFSPSTPELDQSLDGLRGGQLTPCPSAGWPSPLGRVPSPFP